MKKSFFISTLLTASTLLSVSFSAMAGDFEWSGLYRIEGVHISNTELSDSNKEKDYGLHHLILRPKIVAGDGLHVQGRFDIFNGSGSLASTQMGQVFGSGVGGSTPSSSMDSNVASEWQQSDVLRVSQLYLTLIQEFGSLVVGRAPLQFGLGITHNAGNGMFDHWMDTRDLVGYKIVMGNLFFFPMIGKVNEGDLVTNDDVNDYMIQVQYDNPETDIEMGAFFHQRKASQGANDAPLTALGGAGATTVGAYSVQTINLYAAKDSEKFKLGVEASFQSGKTGVQPASGGEVSMGGYGVAGDLEIRPEASRWKYGAKFGVASGDDPNSTDKFEGYIFDRNYDVAFLLFNHPLGKANADIFNTDLVDGGDGSSSYADTEAISNVIYFSPRFDFQWKDRWTIGGSITAGWLNQNQFPSQDLGKGVGYEVDLSINFVPNKRVTWVNQLGLLMPGEAFGTESNGSGTFDTKFAYGLTTKAAISF